MAWYEIVGYLLGGSGVVGGVYTIFTAKVKKESIIIENFKQVIDEIKEHHKDYKEEMDKRIEKLEYKVSSIELKDKLKQEAINKAYRCPYIPKDGDCPVIVESDRYCNLIKEEFKKKQQL